MAEKTEAPTPRRREEARQRGQIARSPEVNAAIGLLLGFTLLRSLGPSVVAQLAEVVESTLGGAATGLDTPEALRTFAIHLGVRIGLALLPLFGSLVLAGVVASVAQVGFYFSGQALVPRWNQVNPLEGLRRLLSLRGLQELAKALAKTALVAVIVYSALQGHINSLVGLARVDLNAGVAAMWSLATGIGLRVGLLMVVLAGGDYIFQRWQLNKSLRMTRQELIEELKRYENPFVRARIRQQQRAMAMQRMMAAVPQADVVITNPTELAVAIKYDASTMPAPQVVAKGRRLIAQRIRELAIANGVPVLERKPVARALFAATEVGMEIPADLYQAVAEVLAFVYSLKEGRR